MSMKADLHVVISEWDGRRKDTLEELCQRHHRTAEFPNNLVDLCGKEGCADGATWCLKWLAEQGSRIPEFDDLVSHAVAAPGWAAKLHVLQVAERHGPELDPGPFHKLVLQACASPKPMLRAWGYFGADLLARQCADLRAEMSERLAKARAVETAGSIKARLKRCRF